MSARVSTLPIRLHVAGDPFVWTLPKMIQKTLPCMPIGMTMNVVNTDTMIRSGAHT